METNPKGRICFVTLGCAKNEVDTAHMQARLREAGYEIHDGEALDCTASVESIDPFDAIIVNTCSFLQEAIEESLEVIFDIAQLSAVEQGRTKLIVSGCMPARFGNGLEEELTEPNLFVPCADEHLIVSKLDALLGV